MQDHIDLIRRHFAFEERGDTEAAIAEMTPDSHYFIPSYSDARMTTRDEIRAVHLRLSSSLQNLRIKLDSIVVSESRAAAEVEISGNLVKEFNGIPPKGQFVRWHAAAIF